MFPYAVYRRGIKNRDALAGGNVASFLINTTGLADPGVPGVPYTALIEIILRIPAS